MSARVKMATLRPRRRSSALRRREAWAGVLFASPVIVGLLALAAYPAAAMFYYSFTDYNILRPPLWTGWSNYQDMVTNDPEFWTSLGNTVYYVAISVPVGLVVSLTLALLLNQKLRTVPLFRALFYLPSVVPTVAGTLIWLWILNPQYGIINQALGALGIQGPSWLSDTAWSKPGLILMSLWGIGPSVIIFLAGLQDVPQILYEAATIDGAGMLRRFWKVTLPLITPTLLFNLVLGIINAFQVFAQAYIYSQTATGDGQGASGNPGESTLMFVVYLYAKAFRDFDMGYACALALVLFLIILALTLLVLATSRRWVYYEGAR
jgi:multiple sugar transport system permease protein